MKSKIIAIHGLAGHGKDTLAVMIAEKVKELENNKDVHPQIFVESFAAKVKGNIESITGEKMKSMKGFDVFNNRKYDFTREQKAKVLPIFNMSLGKFMQIYATEACRDVVHKDIWCIAMFNVFDRLEVPYRFITDLRIRNEYDLLDDRNEEVIFVKIDRGGIDMNDGRDKDHLSEKGLPDELFDYIVYNDEGLSELREDANYIAEKIVKK